jgi:hypothetical protein
MAKKCRVSLRERLALWRARRNPADFVDVHGLIVPWISVDADFEDRTVEVHTSESFANPDVAWRIFWELAGVNPVVHNIAGVDTLSLKAPENVTLDGFIDLQADAVRIVKEALGLADGEFVTYSPAEVLPGRVKRQQ